MGFLTWGPNSKLGPHEWPGPHPAHQLGLKAQNIGVCMGGGAQGDDGLRPAPICLSIQKDVPQLRLGVLSVPSACVVRMLSRQEENMNMSDMNMD